MSLNDLYISKFERAIHSVDLDRAIIVVLGAPNSLSTTLNSKYFIDLDTFNNDQESSPFTKDWSAKLFTELHTAKDKILISYAQYVHFANKISTDLFSERLVLIKDNLRVLYSLKEQFFIESTEGENLELRSEKLPLHHSEQIKIADNYYYLVKQPTGFEKVVDVFKERIAPQVGNDKEYEVLDNLTDPYCLDKFLTDILGNKREVNSVALKRHAKKELLKTQLFIIEGINWLLDQLGYDLSFVEDEAKEKDFQVPKSTIKALNKFWGNAASFRKLRVYKSPNTSKEVIEISQGQIVQNIVNEYHRTKKGLDARDLFLTAPTGAGKSLLFQLPAFIISESGDMTIVVSPLIALMKDQVQAIMRDRKYHKVAYINSELTLVDREVLLERCHQGEIDVLYLSPELLLSYDIKHFLGERTLGLLVIDEAHLITTWGRDFRVDYWFLGNYIRKVKKFNDYKFPVVAVTATAIYGGANDMVFDTIDSLSMQDPHIYIGEVRRNDIAFLVSNYKGFDTSYEKKKIDQTVDFIESITKRTQLKTLVYTPYEKHVTNLVDSLEGKGIQVSYYYGRLNAGIKQNSFEQFLKGEKQVMISTKAFGMGVDIPDIQVVYHHAPSGLLPDYIQEIGRVARRPDIKGYATLNYSIQDQRYSKQLHGMSALRIGQIIEVLKKINKTYEVSKHRNLLLSVDDFAYIFPDSEDLDQKVLTSLMMIEKDYLKKYRFNVIVARPKKLFVKVYGKVSPEGYQRLVGKYKEKISMITSRKNGDIIIEIDLDRIWMSDFRDRNFAALKYDYYTQELFKRVGIEVTPQLKAEYTLFLDYDSILDRLTKTTNALSKVLASLKSFFSEEELATELGKKIRNVALGNKLSQYVISNYSGRLLPQGYVQDGGFIQQRRNDGKVKFLVRSTKYLQEFASYLKIFSSLFGDNESNQATRYVTNREIASVKYSRLGYLLEVLDLGLFELKGGENPMVFVRINDPDRVKSDCNRRYKNSIHQKTIDRHYLSSEIFDHFFLHYFSDEERWNFIEEYFLGTDVDELKESFQGSTQQEIDFFKILDHVEVSEEEEEDNEGTNEPIIQEFPPNKGTTYWEDNMLTIEKEGIRITKTISKWMQHDPVELHKCIVKNGLTLNEKSKTILISKLVANHPEYYDDFLGSKKIVDFPKIGRVPASVPMNNQPVEFYTWWKVDESQVRLSTKEKIVLFDKVNQLKPAILLTKHKRLISK